MVFMNKDLGWKRPSVSLARCFFFFAWGSFNIPKQMLRKQKENKFGWNWTWLDWKNSWGDIFVCVSMFEARAGWSRDIHHLKIQIPGWNALSEKLYIYVYTHIHIYTYIQVTKCEYLADKKYKLFYNNSTIDFIIIHSNFDTLWQ